MHLQRPLVGAPGDGPGLRVWEGTAASGLVPGEARDARPHFLESFKMGREGRCIQRAAEPTDPAIKPCESCGVGES